MAPSRGLKRTADGDIKHLRKMTQINGLPAQSLYHKRGGKVVNFEELETSQEAKSRNHTPNLKQRSSELLFQRQQLPIWKHRNEICSKLRSDHVLLLAGETGSGKSTQIPQFLVNEPWCERVKLKDGSSIGGCIAITEPRRVAAISLAKRVAEEMGTPLGTSSPASQVGYSVRFDNNTGPATRIKFLTEGMMLQEMLRDPWLKDYSAVVVDEVHERGLNVDLVLGFLRRMHEQSNPQDGREGKRLKLVVMSATADMEKIQRYLSLQNTKLDSHSLQNQEDEWHGFSESDEPSASAASDKDNVSTLSIKGRQHPVTVHYVASPVADLLEATLNRIIDIHNHAPLPGDVLVFLTGQETVESLLSLVEAYSASIRKDPKFSELPSLLILPLYAALPPHLQQRVFERTPKSTRKIIISTNIAETSITVPGIRHVVDCGKHKRRLFRPSLNLDSLLTVPISRSSAKQRSGRAGRDAPGQAYRLYTEAAFYNLAVDTEPEVLRCDLSQLVLALKSHGINDLESFPLLTEPPRRGLERAIVHLLQLSALSPQTGAITSSGREMSLLPLPSHLARILLSSSLPQYSCVSEIIDIVSALSVENIFLNIHSSQDAQDNDSDDDSSSDPRLDLRSRLHRHSSDHLTLLAVVEAYVDENTDRKRWCEERGISHRAMQSVMDARKQLTGIMSRRDRSQTTKNINTHPPTTEPPSTSPTAQSQAEDLTTRILKCLLTGLHPNVARLSSTSTSSTPSSTSHSLGTYITLSNHQQINIHPSSVLFSATRSHTHTNSNRRTPGTTIKPEAIMSSEYVYTTKPYARCVSAIQLDWVREVTSEASFQGAG